MNTEGCPKNSASCITFKDGRKPESIGYLSKGVQVHNGSLSIEYEGGSYKCQGNNPARTIINFVCKPGVAVSVKI